MSISLEGSIRTCKVDVGWASRLQSDRFENSSLLVCPPWNGVDTYGRRVCPDSYVTKTAGCNSADDRVEVENALRPQYMEYVNLDAAGIRGDIYSNGMNGGGQFSNTMPYNQEGARSKALHDLSKITGSAGFEYGANIYPRCSGYAYNDAQTQLAKQQRSQNQLLESYKSNQQKIHAGFGYNQSF